MVAALSHPQKGPEVRKLADRVDYQAGAIVSKMLLKRETGSVTLFAFDRGQALSEHTTPYEALVVLLDGEAEVTIGGQGYRLRPGETITFPPGIPHSVRAAERFKMMLVMIRE